MIAGFIFALILAGAVIWFALDRRENKRSEAGQSRHSAIRLVFAAAALLIMLFAGGCSLVFLASMDGTYVSIPAILTIGGPPFVAGLVMWWLSMRRKQG
jgi:hypothetical protein